MNEEQPLSAAGRPSSAGHRLESIVRAFRPTLWPFIWAHAFAGFIAAHGSAVFRLDLESWLNGLVAGGHWAVLLGGSAAALTSVFESASPDALNAEPCEGPAKPPQRLAGVTRSSLGWGALALLLLGLASSLVFNWSYFDAYLIGLILAVVYAAPPLQLSGLRLGGTAARAFGFGALTFYSGYASSDFPEFRVPFSPLYLIAFILLFLALETALRPGSSRVAGWLYWLFLAGGFACLAAAEVRLGNRFGTALLIVPLAGWCVAGLRRERAQSGTPPLTGAAALGLCLATDAGVALAALLR